ncbi:hypothetical protein ACKS0A_11543 [Histoplasma ohiense]
MEAVACCNNSRAAALWAGAGQKSQGHIWQALFAWRDMQIERIPEAPFLRISHPFFFFFGIRCHPPHAKRVAHADLQRVCKLDM